jgi:trans-2-enoyl-CoA reductase
MQELEADDASESDSEPTKAELYEKAQDLEVEGRSQMDKDELQQAIHQAEAEQLDELTRDQLYEKAQALEIEGRSQMNKDELKQAIQSAR